MADSVLPRLVERGRIRTAEVMAAVHRRAFVPSNLVAKITVDEQMVLPKLNITIGSVMLYADILDALELKEGNSVLDVGCGCGHLTAIAGYLVGKKGYAIGLDINKSTVEFAQKCLKRLDLPNDLIANVAFFNLNVYFLDKKIKFDRLIIAAVCPRNIVMHILGQMKDGGICVLVTEDMKLVRYRLTPKGDWTQEILGEVKEALPKLVIPDMLQMEGQLQHANDTIDALKAWITKWTGVDPTKKGLGGSGGSGSSGLSNPGSVPTSPLAGSGPTPNKTSGGSVRSATRSSGSVGATAIYCDVCGERISSGSLRWRCNDCGDFDMCEKCFAGGPPYPPPHNFFVHSDISAFTTGAQSIEVDVSTMSQFKCVSCNKTIVGLRYKCLVCSDWNQCASCQSTLREPLKKTKHTFAHSLKCYQEPGQREIGDKKTPNKRLSSSALSTSTSNIGPVRSPSTNKSLASSGSTKKVHSDNTWAAAVEHLQQSQPSLFASAPTKRETKPAPIPPLFQITTTPPSSSLKASTSRRLSADGRPEKLRTEPGLRELEPKVQELSGSAGSDDGKSESPSVQPIIFGAASTAPKPPLTHGPDVHRAGIVPLPTVFEVGSPKAAPGIPFWMQADNSASGSVSTSVDEIKARTGSSSSLVNSGNTVTSAGGEAQTKSLAIAYFGDESNGKHKEPIVVTVPVVPQPTTPAPSTGENRPIFGSVAALSTSTAQLKLSNESPASRLSVSTASVSGVSSPTIDIPIINWGELEIRDLLGAGAFGSVHSGLWRGAPVAIKRLHTAPDNPLIFKHEASIMRKMCHHPNIIRLYGVCDDPNNFAIVEQLCPHGSLLDVIKKIDEVPWYRVVGIARDATAGAYHLHCENLIHRDLACRNILVGDNWTGVVSDFGLSRLLESGNRSHRTESMAAVRWMAPECLRDEKYSTKSDVWSFGMCLVEILTRNQPYHDKSYQEILKAVYMGAPLPVEIPDTVDPVMKQLTLDCLKQDPEQRICFKEILSRLDAHYRTLTAGAQR